MIHLVNLHSVNPDDYDVIYAIIRSFKKRDDYACIIQMRDLSPSQDLFLKYCEWKNQGLWDYDIFDNLYVDQFVKELKHNPKAIQYLQFLCNQSANGLSVGIGCYCYKEDMCHRSIVGGILLGMGASISFDSNYVRYYKRILRC